MTYLAIVELVVIIVLLARQDRAVSALLETHATREHEWSMERSELLTRAMHPQVVLPPRAMQPAAPAEPAEPDQFEMVGRVLAGEE